MVQFKKTNLTVYFMAITLCIYVVVNLNINHMTPLWRRPNPEHYEESREHINQSYTPHTLPALTQPSGKDAVPGSTEAHLGGGSGQTEAAQNTTKPLSTDDCLQVPSFHITQPIPLQECGAPHVLMHDGGRLGNLMCQYLSLHLLRHLFGVRVSITKRMRKALSKVFQNISLPVKDPACFPANTTDIAYTDLYRLLYDEGQSVANRNGGFVNESLISKSYYVFNHPCPRDLLLAHRDLLRPLLVFKKNVLDKASHVISVALSRVNQPRKNVTLVTVHVRRGDYIRYIKKHYNLQELTEIYFQRAFEFYRQRVAQPVFVVVSDNREWCKVLSAPDVKLTSSKYPEVDQAVMTLGDHTVTSYGTFSFMGALLGHGNFTHPINDNPRYTIFNCVNSQYLHFIPRD